MASLTLTPTDGSALDLLGASFELVREGTIESILPIPLFDAEYAESVDTEGGIRVRARPQNRTGSGRILIKGTSASDFRAQVRIWQETVNQVQTRGGALTYTPTGGTAVTYDLTEMHITSLPQDLTIERNFREFSEFEYTCKPFGRLASSTIFTGSAGSTAIWGVAVTPLPGSAPGLGKITLTDTAGQARRHVEVGVDENYNPGSPSSLTLTSANATTSGFAGTSTTRAGSISANVIRGTLNITPQAFFKLTSTTLVGKHRIRARVYGVTSSNIQPRTPIYLRLRWRLGTGLWELGDWVNVPYEDQWFELDLGLIDVPTPVVGTTNWELWFEAYSTTTADTIDFDLMEFMPASRLARARAPVQTGVATGPSVQDAFDQTAGALTGKVLPLGGTWTVGATSDTDDFSVDATNHWATRTAVNDTGSPRTGRLVYANGPSLSDVVAQTDFFRSAQADGAIEQYLMVRYTDNNNLMYVGCESWTASSPDTGSNLTVILRTTATGKVELWHSDEDGFPSNAWLGLRVQVGADGTYTFWAKNAAGEWNIYNAGFHQALSSTGALASGKVGLWDAHIGGGIASTRNYDNFTAFSASSATGVVMNANKTAVLRHDTMLTEPTSGTAYGKVPAFEGSYLKLPPGRDLRLAFRARRNDSDAEVDAGTTDAFTATLEYTPRVLLLG